MKGWVGLAGSWLICSGRFTHSDGHSCRSSAKQKVHWPETVVLPLCHAINSRVQSATSKLQVQFGTPPNRYTTRMHGTSYSVLSVCVCASAMSLESWLREISGPSNSGPPADQQRMTPVDDLPRLGSADAVSPFDDDNTSEVSRCSRFETMPARRRDVQKLQPVQPADYRYIYRLPSLEILKKKFQIYQSDKCMGVGNFAPFLASSANLP